MTKSQGLRTNRGKWHGSEVDFLMAARAETPPWPYRKIAERLGRSRVVCELRHHLEMKARRQQQNNNEGAAI